ncbi:reverse transcriptase domain-containing protein [Tanacetum coccineum]
MPFGLMNDGATYQWLVDNLLTARFLSKSAEKSLLLFKILKRCIKKSDFHWTPEVKQAFKQLKQHLSELPLLVAPKPKEELIVYLSASHGAISEVLMTKRGTIQTPIYFISHALQGPELNYTSMEKLVLALVFAAKRFQFTAFNNKAEYEALIAGLQIAVQMGVLNVHVIVDSKLVVNQVLGTYVAKEENMVKYLENAKSLISGFTNFSISQVPRSKNKKADALSKITSTSFTHLSKQVLVEVFKEKSIQEEEVMTVVEKEGPTWMTPIIEYLKDGTLSDDRKEASKLRKVNFLIVAMDYFTKWIEAKAVATITDNQFSDNPFKDWYEKLNITQCFASVKHLQSNGLVERTNWSLSEGIKAHFSEGNKNWIEELPHVLWAYRTMFKSSHGDTPLSLTYGTEAIILAEIRMPMYRIVVVDAIHNDEELQLYLDLLEERHERTAIHEAKAKLKMTKYYNVRVHGVTFRPGDFVYRSNEASHAMDGGKLGLMWEGPYEVTEALGDGAYKLRFMDNAILLRTWNIANLKKCYL